MLTPEEAHIVSQLKQGKNKEKAFQELVNLYKEPLYWHIRNIVKNHDDTDDVLQNTFIKVFRYIDNFKEESKLYSWLYRIASNESFTFLSKKAKRLKISDEELQESLIENLTSDTYFEGKTIQIALQKAINTLPEKQKVVFQMKYFEDLKYQEIAEILEVTEGTAKSNYHHAVQKIKNNLEDHSTFDF
ncbi:RNA polymerase sigma factor [Mesonia sp. K7]|uniref:RNA polymerase sigma factor n=1 Tax=Mesonia sp. K7 TaxID=2218606 RepID=UPI000DA898BD|nr:RNA polymerase sigma factor [Mesonia sp. K7]PZD77917.1 RNA polymerase subunit sigma-70 [Mesonia sp. K7]